MAKHFFTPGYPTVAGAYWLRRKTDKPPTLVKVGIAMDGVVVADDLDRQRAGAIGNGLFEGDWLGPIEPKEGIPLGWLTSGVNCPNLVILDDNSTSCFLAGRACPGTIPDYCPLRGE